MSAGSIFGTLAVVALGQPITKSAAFKLKDHLLSNKNGRQMSQKTFYANIDSLLESRLIEKASPKRYRLTAIGNNALNQIGIWRAVNDRRMFLLKDGYRAKKSMRGSERIGR